MMVRIIRWFVLLGNGLLILSLLLSYVTVYFPPQSSGIIPLFGLFLPYLLLANLFMVLLWTVWGSKYFWGSALAIIIGFPWIFDSVQITGGQIQQSKDQLQIVSLNIHQYVDLYEIKKSDSWGQFEKEWNAFLRKHNGMNILCLQEHRDNRALQLPGLDELPHTYQCTSRGPIIYSRFPILQTGCFTWKNPVNSGIFADILPPFGDTVRIYNIHLQSNQVGDLADALIHEGELQEVKLQQTRKMVGRYIRTAGDRVEQMEEILAHIQACPYPVILVGDFNEGPQSYVYRIASARLQDAFTKKGMGFSSTYAGRLPFLRIDHIFYSEPFEIKGYAVGRVHCSDHYPVFGGFSWP